MTMKHPSGTLWIFLQTIFNPSFGTILDEIQRMYLRQGIPFRENVFLGNQPIMPEYDFIIVGSGPAGSSIANRLSEVPQWNILLLERGNEGNIYDDVPLIHEYTVLGEFSDNIDLEKEETACLGLVDGRCHWPSGNGIGGATLINGMIYTRGFPLDYDNWAFQGNPGWSYKEVLPYFLKYENMSIRDLSKSEYHSTNGPVHVQYPFQTKLGRLFLEAGREIGYDLVDYNNPKTQVGFSATQVTMRGVKRESAASAYLYPAKSRPNLHIAKKCLVTKLLIDPDSKRVFGVQYVKGGKTRNVRARNEVIVSGGTFGSPKLLMLSGIGPADHLRRMGIPLIADLPVGNNLQEHLGNVVTFLINTTDSIVIPKLLKTATSNFIQWLRSESGIFSSNIAECLGYVQTKYARDERPDIELVFVPTTLGSDGGLLWPKTRNISNELYKSTYQPIAYKEGFSIVPMGMYPKSRGKLRLKSANPNDPVVIVGSFLKDPDDVAVLREGAKIAMKVGATKAFQRVGATPYRKQMLGCEQFQFNTDEYWECSAKTLTIQWHHQVGTCKMGSNPSESVVDSRLRVHGVSGLRVADASIMPLIPGPHTMASSYMVGEKAADLIKEDWGVLS